MFHPVVRVISWLTFELLLTVIFKTFDSTAPVQSASQSTLAKRLYHVVVVKTPGEKVSELELAISTNPAELLVVDFCHLYSILPL